MDNLSLENLSKLLCSTDLSTVKQGVDLWSQLDDENVTNSLLEGLLLTPDGDAPFYFEEPGRLAAARWQVEAAFAVVVQRGLLAEATNMMLGENNLTDLSLLKELPSLKTLSLPLYSPSVEQLCGFEALSTCPQLVALSLHRQSFDNLPDDLISRLESLTLCYNEEGEDIPDLSLAVSLKYLELDECSELLSIEEVASLENLEKLTIFNGCSIDDLSPLSELYSLEELRLIACSRCWDFGPVSDLTALKNLSVSHTRAFTDLEWLSSLTNLTQLSLYECTRLYDIDAIVELGNLTRLKLDNCKNLEECSPIADLSDLQHLSLNRTNLESIEFVQELEQLQTLYVVGCTKLTDIPCLERLTNLKILNLNGCSALTDESKANAQSLVKMGCNVLGL